MLRLISVVFYVTDLFIWNIWWFFTLTQQELLVKNLTMSYVFSWRVGLNNSDGAWTKNSTPPKRIPINPPCLLQNINSSFINLSPHQIQRHKISHHATFKKLMLFSGNRDWHMTRHPHGIIWNNFVILPRYYSITIP